MIENMLPKSYPYKVLRRSVNSNEKFQCEIRAKINTVEDFSVWLKEFENITNTCWIVRDTVSSEKSKYLLSKNYVCQHSAYRKKKDTSKNKNCLASFHVRIKRNTKFIRCRDPYAKEGFRAVIRMNFNHSHKLDEPEVWNWLPRSNETKAIFYDLFDCGMSPAAAKTYHRSVLLAECPEYMANGRLNPPGRWIYNLYQKWLKKNSVNYNIRPKYESSRVCLSQSKVLKREFEEVMSQIEDVDLSALIKDEPDTLFDTSISFEGYNQLEGTPNQNQPKRERAYSDSDSFSDIRSADNESYYETKTPNEIFGELVACYLDKLSTLDKQSDARIKITKMLIDELIIDN